MKKTAIILTALLLTGIAHAQYNETNNLFYHAQRIPQSNTLNPAFFPGNNSVYVTLPSTGLQFGFPLSIHDIVRYDSKQKANIIDINGVFDKISADNPFRMNWDMGLLGFGFRAGDLFFTFNTQLRTSMTLGLSGGIVSALTGGNMDDNGNPIPSVTVLNGNAFNAQMYLETSLGAGYQVPVIPLTVGVHAKLLSGVFNIQTDNTNIVIETDPNFDKVTARVYYEAMEAAAVPIDTAGGTKNILANLTKHLGEAVETMFDPINGNTGLAFDIGAKYDMGPFTFSLAVNDLSAGIHWQKNVNSMVPTGGQGVIEFEGMQVNNLLNRGQMNMDSLKYVAEQFKSLLPRFEQNTKDYWYNVPTKINAGASFNFLKLLRAGLLFHGQFDRGLLSKQNVTTLDLGGNVANTFRFNTTATLGVNVFDWIELILGTSLVFDGNKADFFNPGAGFVLSIGTAVQSYLIADYISNIYITDAKAFNLKFGLNLLIGHGGRKRVLDI